MKIDELDARIIDALQEDSRRTAAEIARRLGVHQNTIRYRIRRLMRNGVIRRFTVLLDPRALGLTVSAALMIKVEPGRLESVAERLIGMREVTNVYQLSGEYDLIAVVFGTDLQDLQGRVSAVRRIEGVREVHVFVTTRVLKSEVRYQLVSPSAQLSRQGQGP
ncbi:MAG: Lrp/AsnC family transcriptional regulator [Thaumarchaeota archaeon]|nr:Lrp/AsnC family transcriptional regulator [Candidatus Calditenuaceae archaeon]MCX8203739.1 Lrp/AsnC family transcriptional regulator [Nitrososphaeria archaeon]MDW8043127.1 Lrp/AsnC family transcriptional regulator [Nitrososphaerota archaeon]